MFARFLLFFYLLLPFLGVSQTRPTIDVLSGYEYSNLITDRQVFPDPDEFSSYDRSGTFSFRYGLNYNQPLAEKWALKVGLRYVQNGEKEVRGLRWGSQFDPSTGAVFVDNAERATLANQHRFFSMPIALRYTLGSNNRKLNFYLEGGAAAAFYLNTQSITSLTGEGSKASSSLVEEVGAIRRWHFLGSLAFGANYDVGEKVQLFLQPTFRYHLTPLANGNFKEHLYNFGLEIGGRFAIL